MAQQRLGFHPMWNENGGLGNARKDVYPNWGAQDMKEYPLAMVKSPSLVPEYSLPSVYLTVTSILALVVPTFGDIQIHLVAAP